jgi:hypothetical protein
MAQPTGAAITAPPGGWFADWGTVVSSNSSGPTIRCTVIVTPLIPYRDKIHLMLIYRRDDKTVNEDDDADIEKSALFSVGADDRLSMDTALPNGLIISPTDHRTGSIAVEMRVILVILPGNTPQGAISKLSDVRKHGGDIASRNGFPITITRKAMQAPSP